MTVIYTTELCLSGMNSRIIKYGAMIHSIWTDYAFNNVCHRQFSGMAYYYLQACAHYKGVPTIRRSMTIPRCSGHRPNLLSIRLWTNERPSAMTLWWHQWRRHREATATSSRWPLPMSPPPQEWKGAPRRPCGWGFGVLARGWGTCPWVGLG